MLSAKELSKPSRFKIKSFYSVQYMKFNLELNQTCFGGKPAIHSSFCIKLTIYINLVCPNLLKRNNLNDKGTHHCKLNVLNKLAGG